MKKLILVFILTMITLQAGSLSKDTYYKHIKYHKTVTGHVYFITQGVNKFKTSEYYLVYADTGKCISFLDNNSQLDTTICGSFIIQTR